MGFVVILYILYVCLCLCGLFDFVWAFLFLSSLFSVFSFFLVVADVFFHSNVSSGHGLSQWLCI